MLYKSGLYKKMIWLFTAELMWETIIEHLVHMRNLSEMYSLKLVLGREELENP